MLGLDSTLRRYLVMGAFPEVLYGRSEGDDLADVLRSQDLLRRGAIEQARQLKDRSDNFIKNLLAS